MIEAKNEQFLLDGKPFNIYSGAVHYFRIMPEYWEDTLLKLKLAGFNTVETYVCWNLHEKEPGKFDFSGILDIVKFLETAKKLGLYAIVRPGPYICAEWDFGGLPAWLLKDKNLRIRCMYKPYTDAVTRFYKELLSRIDSLQYSKGGNIIAMQVENEYGSYGNDREYLRFIKNLMLECGVCEMLFTSDGAEDEMLSGGGLEDIVKVANFGSRANEAFGTLKKYQSDKPSMCGEFWNGWFDGWGEEYHHTRPSGEVVDEMNKMLACNASFNFYTFHGGTNFGFTSGANFYGKFQPDVTSYDDDALINEWGGYTEKYHAVRKALLEYRGISPKELPNEPERQNIGKVKLTEFTPLLENLKNIATKIKSTVPESMEFFSQNSGFILYHHKLKGNYNSKLFIDGLGDRAHIFINRELKGIIYRNDENQYIELDTLQGENDIDILVEDMGRINYGPFMLDRKGVNQIRINNQLLFDWDIYLIPLDSTEKLVFDGTSNKYPLFMKGKFTAQKNKTCFVHLDGFTKGYVFVNGFNLGRYWEIGPQKSLYVPGVLLKEENEIIVLELDKASQTTVSITDIHDIGKTK